MTRVKLQLKRYGRYFAVLIALWVVGIAAGGYIVINQRFPNPFASFVKVNGTFNTAAGDLGDSPVEFVGVGHADQMCHIGHRVAGAKGGSRLSYFDDLAMIVVVQAEVDDSAESQRSGIDEHVLGAWVGVKCDRWIRHAPHALTHHSREVSR